MIRRDAYLRVGGLDNRLWYTADWDLYLKIAFLGTVYYYPYPLACYRVHCSTLTIGGSRDLKDFRSQYQIVVNRHIAKITGTRANEILRISESVYRRQHSARGRNKGEFCLYTQSTDRPTRAWAETNAEIFHLFPNHSPVPSSPTSADYRRI